jgi:hypothetical protein
MKKVIDYEIASGKWSTRLASDSVRLSAGEIEAQIVTCDITSWSDERLSEFATQDKESQLFDLECLEFEVFSREFSLLKKI